MDKIRILSFTCIIGFPFQLVDVLIIYLYMYHCCSILAFACPQLYGWVGKMYVIFTEYHMLLCRHFPLHLRGFKHDSLLPMISSYQLNNALLFSRFSFTFSCSGHFGQNLTQCKTSLFHVFSLCIHYIMTMHDFLQQ